MEHFVSPVFEEIWNDRYRKNGESYDENLWRVARAVAQAEPEKDRQDWELEFYGILKSGDFFPGGRTMSNAGIGEKLTLNNCFVAPMVDDSMEGIFEAVKLGAVTHKAGGGIGYSFSNLAPNGRKTHNDAIASGPVSFMDVFNAQTRTVQQGSRRGANMGVLSVYHPDIFEFLNAKASDPNRLNHFNLSVMVDDEFMAAVEADDYITLHWPIYDENGNHLSEEWWDPQFTWNIKANEIWDVIMQKAYDNGEPGVFFEDTLRDWNPANYIENIVCSNPCGEYLAGTISVTGEPRAYGGACNLGSLMLHKFVDKPFTKDASVDWFRLGGAISVAVRFLDDIIDINKFPDKIYENYQKNMRTIGLGYTGLADMLAMLGMKYNSYNALAFTEELMRFCAAEAYIASIELAKEKGCFPLCNKEFHSRSPYVNRILGMRDIDDICKYGIRNAKIQAVAPTGTMSLTFGNNCSSGIEPIFSLSYKRKVKVGGQEEDNEQVVEVMDYAYWLYNKMVSEGQHVDYAPEDIFVTALEMTVDEHINMLEVIQKYVDMSVSKTINVPTNYSFEDTKNIYMECWNRGIKGCTIFRPNALRPGVLITEETTQETKDALIPEKSDSVLHWGDVIECSDGLIGKKRKLTTGCGSLHVLAYFDPSTGDLQECYLAKGSTGGCANYMTGLSRMISLSARAGVSVYTIKDQLDSTGTCPSYAVRRATHRDTSKGSCCAMAVGNALIDMYEELRTEMAWEEPEDDGDVTYTNSIPQPDYDHNSIALRPVYAVSTAKCPNCGEPLTFEGGCQTCKSCGWDKCE